MSASVKNTKVAKKNWKKQNKRKLSLLKRNKIIYVETPTAILCVSNGGLDNGVTYEEILQLFGSYGKRCDVIMLPQKPYSFVCYLSVAEAEAAYSALNGHTLGVTEKRKTDVILYLAYVREVPEGVCLSTEQPPGLVLLEEFVTSEYADQIMRSINWDDKPNNAQEQELKHRRVKHYGYEFKYTINNVDPDDPLPDSVPDVYKPLLDKLLETGHVKHVPDQLTINQYQPGQGIPQHVDTPSAFEDGLVSLSLGSQVLMEFRQPDGRHLSALLPDKSVLIMTGESRYIWSHGITPRKSDIIPTPGGGLTLSQRGVRTSFTFRKITGVRPGEETSDQPSLPDSDAAAAQLENLHVHKVYEKIADHFSGTRHTPWPRIAEFLQQQPPGSLLADIGCGNGKYFGINKNIYELGSDRSSNLAQICHDRKFQVFVGDVLAIPLRSATFDVCLCIAVIHHLATHERRVRAVSELLKILRPGGQALIYVWAIEQELNKTKSKYLKGNKQADAKGDTETVMQDDLGVTSGKEFGDNRSEIEEIHINETVVHVGSKSGKEYDEKHPEIENVGFEERDNSNNIRFNDKTKIVKSDGDFSKASAKERFEVNEERDRNEGEIVKSDSVQTRLTNEHKVQDNDKSDNDTKDRGDPNETGARSKTKAQPQKLEVHVNRTKFKQQDLLVPWQLKSKECKSADTFHRFYHVFQKGEMERLCQSIGCCRVVKSYYDQGNWAVILEKI